MPMADAERSVCRHTWCERLSREREPLAAVTKADLKAAVDAADQWIDDNKSSFNVAIPQPARRELTAKQKAQLLMYVVSRRFDLGVY